MSFVADGLTIYGTYRHRDGGSGQARCDAEQPLIAALQHTELTVVELEGVNHVLRDDPSDSIANYAKQEPLSAQLVGALDDFVGQ